MKKLVAIFLLVIYFNTAFAIGIDYHYCGGKIANVSLKIFGKAECKNVPRQVPMGCCQNETIYCQTDDHQAQVETTLLSISYNDYDNVYKLVSRPELMDGAVVKRFDHYFFIRTRSSREILSFIQILRI